MWSFHEQQARAWQWHLRRLSQAFCTIARGIDNIYIRNYP